MAFIYNLTDTWNDVTTTWNGIKLAVTDTGSSATSKLLNLTVTGSSTASFVVDKNGNLALNGSVNKITMTAPATGATLTLADNSTFITSGAYSSTFTFTGATTLTFPTSGTVTALGNTTTGSGAIVLATGPSITLTNATGLPLATGVTGTLPIANGGTGQTTANAAFNALAPSQSGNNGKYLTTDGSNTSWATNPLGTVTSVDVSGGSTGLSFSGGPITTSGTITMAGTLAAANGGTGLTSLGTGVATWLGAPSSANLAAAVTDETGSGPLVFATAPTFGTNITVGTASSSTGIVNLKGTTSGTVALSVADAAGSWTMKLPTTAGTNGYYLQTDGLGNTTWAAGGGGGGGSPGGSNTQVQFNNAGTFGGDAAFTFVNGTGTATMSLGVASTTSAALKLYNSSSANSVSIASGNNTASWTMTLPPDDGAANQFLQTDGSGNTIWAAAAAGTINSGTSGQLTYYTGSQTLSGNANATISSGALTLGQAGTAAGSLVLSGSTSGTVTVGVPATAGTTTFTLPSSNGTNNYVLTTNGSGVTSWEQVSLTAGVTGTLPVANGGTGLTSGTSGGVLYYSATGTLASSAALAANALVIGGGAGVAPSTTTTGTGILTFLGTPSSANLASAVTDETGSGALVFGTSPTFTTSITDPLIIGGTSASSTLTLKSTSGVGTSDAIIFQVGNNGATESMRILNDGGLAIGYPTKVVMGSFTPTSEIQASGAAASFGIVRYVTPGGGGAIIALGSSRAAVGSGGTTALQSGDGCGSLAFYGADGTSLVNSVGQIACVVDGTVSTGIVPSRMTISTMSTAGASTERIRADSLGNVMIGTTTPGCMLTVAGQINGAYNNTTGSANTAAQALGTNTMSMVLISADTTLTTTVPAAGARATVIIKTSGANSRTVTFGTGFKSQGTLATGATADRYWAVNFISDGTSLYETSRTTTAYA